MQAQHISQIFSAYFDTLCIFYCIFALTGSAHFEKNAC